MDLLKFIRKKISLSPPDTEMEIKDRLYIIQKNPLLIDLVLSRVFYFAEDYEMLKRYRLVCHKWKEIADPKFIHKSSLVINDRNRKGFSIIRTPRPLILNSVFKSVNHEVRITAFKLEILFLCTSKLIKYVEPNLIFITQLEIDNSYFFMKNDNIDNLIGPNVRKLVVTSCYVQKPTVVTLKKLCKILRIEMKRCKFIFDDNCEDEDKMAPEELSLTHFKRRVNNKSVDIFSMNEIVDFQRLTVLHLNSYRNGHTHTPPILNWSDCKNVKSLILTCIVINLDGIIYPRELALTRNEYRIAGMKIREFLLHHYVQSEHLDKMILQNREVKLDLSVPMSIDKLIIGRGRIIKARAPQTEMKIKNLEIGRLFPLPDIDRNWIPKSIERVHLSLSTQDTQKLSLLSLPNLKQLHISGDILEYLIVFKNSVMIFVLPTLLVLHLMDIPKSPVLDLLVFSGEMNYYMRFENGDELKMLPTLAHLVVLSRLGSKSKYFKECQVHDILKMKEEFNQGNLAFGPVRWKSDKTFRNSQLSKIVDKKSEYYLLEGQTGKGISKCAFSKLISGENSSI